MVVLQYPDMDTGDFVLAAPLYPAGSARPIEIVTPEVSLNGEAWLVGTHLLAGIRRAALGEQIGHLLPHEYEISRALSRLFFGN